MTHNQEPGTRNIYGKVVRIIVDPTPEEIAERAAAIREEWTPTERRKRQVQRCDTELPTCRDHSSQR